MFEGVMVAIVTPFRGGGVDEEAYRRLIDHLIDNGINGIVPCGTTGESPTLSHDEHKRVVEIAVEQVKGRVPVLAGTGSNSTREAIDLTIHAKEAGADGALLVSPYYNKPTQTGLFEHFSAIAEAVHPFPLVLYNIPGRTGVNILPETMARLANVENIVGVKEATGDLGQMARTIEVCPPDFLVTSGDDNLTLPLLAIGGRGVISVAAQVMPRRMADMYQAFTGGDLLETRKIFFELMPLFRAMFLETNPIPVKTAMALMGWCEPDLRLPLAPLSNENLGKLKAVLTGYGLIS